MCYSRARVYLIAQWFLVRIERCGGHEFAVHLREQEHTLAKQAGVQRGEAFERGSVAVSAVPDQDGRQNSSGTLGASRLVIRRSRDERS
jgi:hypothetical protein